MPVIPLLGRQRQDNPELKIAWAKLVRSYFKKTKYKQKGWGHGSNDRALA
jgi:hypothetical protein